MTINRNNFEAYLLDYIEGNLDPLLSADLMAFLAENPEFEKYLPDYDSTISLSGTHEYTRKNFLKKDFADVPELTPQNFEEFCIAACEGLLSDADMNRLTTFIDGNQERQQTLDLYRNLKLHPDTTVIFKEKSALKKKGTLLVNMRYLYFTVGLAASFALLIMLTNRKPAGTVYTERPDLNTPPREINVQPIPDEVPEAVTPVKQGTPTHPVVHASNTINNLPPNVVQQPLPDHEDLNMTALEPITEIQLASKTPTPDITANLSQNDGISGYSLTEGTETGSVDGSSNDTFLGSLFSKIDFWKTAENAVQSFNYLTEAQLSINRTTDESGRLTGLKVGMESYAISGGKIK